MAAVAAEYEGVHRGGLLWNVIFGCGAAMPLYHNKLALTKKMDPHFLLQNLLILFGEF